MWATCVMRTRDRRAYGRDGRAPEPRSFLSSFSKTDQPHAKPSWSGSSRAADSPFDSNRAPCGRRDIALRWPSTRTNVVRAVRGPVADVAHNASTLCLALLLRERFALGRAHRGITGRGALLRWLRGTAAGQDHGDSPTDRLDMHGAFLAYHADKAIYCTFPDPLALASGRELRGMSGTVTATCCSRPGMYLPGMSFPGTTRAIPPGTQEAMQPKELRAG
jgi:hypothetical protein